MCDWNHTRCQPEAKNGGVSLLGYLGLLMPWELNWTSTEMLKKEEKKWLWMAPRWRCRFFPQFLNWAEVEGSLEPGAQWESSQHSKRMAFRMQGWKTHISNHFLPTNNFCQLSQINWFQPFFCLFVCFLNYKFIKILKNCHHRKKPSLQWIVSTCCLLHWLLFRINGIGRIKFCLANSFYFGKSAFSFFLFFSSGKKLSRPSQPSCIISQMWW